MPGFKHQSKQSNECCIGPKIRKPHDPDGTGSDFCLQSIFEVLVVLLEPVLIQHTLNNQTRYNHQKHQSKQTERTNGHRNYYLQQTKTASPRTKRTKAENEYDALRMIRYVAN